MNHTQPDEMGDLAHQSWQWNTSVEKSNRDEGSNTLYFVLLERLKIKPAHMLSRADFSKCHSALV